MLKHQSASAILSRSRSHLVASASPPLKATMTTTENPVRTPQPSEPPMGSIQQKPQRGGPPSMYFPLGYKEAVHQWVSRR